MPRRWRRRSATIWSAAWIRRTPVHWRDDRGGARCAPALPPGCTPLAEFVERAAGAGPPARPDRRRRGRARRPSCRRALAAGPAPGQPGRRPVALGRLRAPAGRAPGRGATRLRQRARLRQLEAGAPSRRRCWRAGARSWPRPTRRPADARGALEQAEAGARAATAGARGGARCRQPGARGRCRRSPPSWQRWPRRRAASSRS